jgi:TonB family protein
VYRIPFAVWLKRMLLRDIVPGRLPLLLSLLTHLTVVALAVMLLNGTRIHFEPEKHEAIRLSPGSIHLSAKAAQTSASSQQPSATHRRRQVRVQQALSSPYSRPGQTLREEAKVATADIMSSLRFHMVYGFYPNHKFDLAIQTAGEVPAISADRVPPHFQQYVMVEVTIDTQGRVAEARIVAGLVDDSIQQTLLSAIREFKYIPAKRDGVPIPSQYDIVIHIPS